MDRQRKGQALQRLRQATCIARPNMRKVPRNMKLDACYTHPILGEMVTLEDAESERDALRAEAADLREALRGLLDCPAMNEDAAEPGTVAAYAAARAALAKHTLRASHSE